jgi:CMP-N,N'-diacetyllegionaminic acid synthase
MLAIIPARGGSKGLPGKNTRMLLGKPLIAYTIEAALNAKHISRVIVSTDDANIAEVARSAGAEIPFLRPTELAQDKSLAIDTYLYTVDQLTTAEKPIQDLVVLLPTAPLRNFRDIDEAIELFREKKADSVVSYYKAEHPLQWYKFIEDEGTLKSVFPEGDRLANRQDEKPAYLPNGAIYVFNYSMLKNKRVYYTDKSYPYLMPAGRSVDIDTLEDFEYAEFLIKKGRA